MNLQTISLEHLKQIVAIKEQITSLEGQLAKILGGKATPEVASAAPVKKGRKKMSASAKAKIASAAKARWAKIKGSTPVLVAPVAPKSAVKSAAVAKPATKARRILSPEGRARIVAALKKRWAKQKKS